ncbi:MAG: CBS domain-containing protein [Candidatus Melainabacteria bacterium]|nr:CBS domain-containing protein [Candidatus Melainabacteria bacterium]
MKVHEIMTIAPMCCRRGDKAQQAANIMRQLNVGVIPIVESDEDDTLIGLVTDRDLCLEVLADGSYPVEKNVEDCMSEDVVTCKADDTLEKVVLLMQRHQVRRIPVVDSQNHIEGIVSLADIAVTAHEQDVADTITEISEPHGF